jgi:hypothetical protein
MRFFRNLFAVFLATVASANFLAAQPLPKIAQGTLIAPGGAPFHLRAKISDGMDATIEMYWVGPEKWRRRIVSDGFAQTLIVNNGQTFEQDSDNFFPVELHTLATAMVDPTPLLGEYKQGGILLTKANGASTESGTTCFDPSHKKCTMHAFGLKETVGVPGHTVDFMDYKTFHGKRIAWRLVYTVSVRDYFTAEVTSLEDLKNPDESLFAITSPTPREQRIETATLQEPELRDLAVEAPQIIWPQALDGAVTGKASFYVAIDPTGKLREVSPVETCNERTNDSAIRQIKAWKFKPAIKDGFAVQAEGILTFDVNTRAWGPANTLSDVEMRQMASNVVEPEVPAGSFPPDTVYKLWVAVDIDGGVLEKIAAGGPPKLFGPCDAALRQWRFRPILENGQPRPYRGLVEFHIQ